MATQYLQGFEQVIPTSVAVGQVLPSEFADFYGLSTPEVSSDWFFNSSGSQDETSGPMITEDDARVTGQCLRIRRPNAGVYQSNFNGSASITLSKALTDQTTVIVGFAVKYSKPSEVPLPLLAFVNATDGEEQTSLWVTPEGAILASSVDWDVTNTGIITPTAVASGQSDDAVFNFQRWMYVEAKLDTGAATPKLTVAINNKIVLEIENASIQKSASATTINKVSICNPHNLYFVGDEYTMFVDDIYVLDGTDDVNNDILGPQYVMFLPAGSPVEAQFTNQGGAVSNAAAVGVQFDKTDLLDFAEAAIDAINDWFTPAALPVEAGTVTVLAVGAFVSIDSGSDPLDLEVKKGSDVAAVNVPVNASTPIYRDAYYDKTPDALVWDRTRVKQVRIGVGS